MRAARRLGRLNVFVGILFAIVLLLGMAGCSLPPALSKSELDVTKLPEKHPPVSAQKEKAGCRSCHREQPPRAAE